ncbi:lactonase family protein [Vibrio sp. CyArs1]|uniref:lactonase family protein n=1 Tax=Vibrio sp. CyArs1 TaxID=2682577 RepID=UPI001F065DCE|nr:lactonase family protein [Vibrio sp. CyArs1]
MIDAHKSPSTHKKYMYVASYTYPHSAPGSDTVSTAKGISVYEIDDSGNHELVQVMESANPSYLTCNSDQSILYCVNELGVDDRKMEGRVSAYRIDAHTGLLTFLNTQSTNGNWPCHCEVTPCGRYLVSANYGTGNFIAHQIEQDGSIGLMVDEVVITLDKIGADPNRQSASHPHMMTAHPSGKFLFGVDLGSDKIYTWSIQQEDRVLSPIAQASTQVASGSGPRHMVNHPNGQFAFVLNELSSTLDVFIVNEATGSMVWKQSTSLLPADTDFQRPIFDPTNPGKVPVGGNTGGAICINDDGSYIYATNRGMNSIVVYAVCGESGKVTAIDWVSTEGCIPRGLSIEPNGNYVVVGNQNSDTIARFKIDKQNGKLQQNPQIILCPVPTDFVFINR